MFRTVRFQYFPLLQQVYAFMSSFQMMRGEKRKTADAATCTIDSSYYWQLVTFARILVAKHFSTRHSDQNGRSLERCINCSLQSVIWVVPVLRSCLIRTALHQNVQQIVTSPAFIWPPCFFVNVINVPNCGRCLISSVFHKWLSFTYRFLPWQFLLH